MNWFDKFIPDFESCVALSTMGFPQKNTTFVWVDTGVLDAQNKTVYAAKRAIEVKPNEFKGVFAAYTAEEFQLVLPLNFVPVRTEKGSFLIVDLYGTSFDQSSKKVDAKVLETRAFTLKKVNGSHAMTIAQAWANAAIFLIQSNLIKMK